MARRWLLAILIMCAGAAGGLIATARHRPGAGGAALPPPAHDRPRVVATTTTTTIPPGELPQTRALPSATSPAFLARMSALVAAAASNRPALAMPAFFPLAAYVQVKAIPDPVRDWHDRLVANFASDIGLVHTELGSGARAAHLVSVEVPATAVWVAPGVEYNKGSYWRVYDTVVTYREGPVVGRFTITSMISWRGQWYVVHLGLIR